MKLLQILYPGLGGHTSVATSLIAGDKERAFNHYLLGYGIEKPSDNLRSYNCDYVLKKQGVDIMSFVKVYNKIRKLKPDRVIAHSTSQIITVFIYSLFYQINWVAVEHQANNAKTKIDWIYSIIILLLAPKIVYLTDNYKKEMMEKFPLLTKRKKIRVIGNGIDLSYFTPGKRIPDGLVNITMISRLNHLRDHHTLIHAFAAVARDNDNCRLKIAGNGETFTQIMELIVKLRLEDKVELLGFLNEEQIISLLHNTDIYVHSSLAETQSTSLLQVMACKIPIIATDIPGINNLLENKVDALLFKPGNHSQLIESLNVYLESNFITQQYTINAFTKVENYYNSTTQFSNYNFILNE